MPQTSHKPIERKALIIGLGIAIFVLFLVLASQQAFNLTFLSPGGAQQTVLLTALSALVFLLFVALTFVLLRNLLKLLSAAILMIGFLMAGWTRRKQALHDKLTGCYVVIVPLAAQRRQAQGQGRS